MSHRRILASAALLATATVAAKMIAFGKDLFVARGFGAGDQLDAFLVAFLIPSFGVTVLASSFAPAFIPTYIRVLDHDGPRAANRLAGNALTASLVLLVSLTLVLAAIGPWVLPWLGSGFDAEKLALAESLSYVTAGVLVAAGLSAVLTAILQARDHFAPGAIASWAVPAVTLAALWLGRERLGILSLAVGTLLGFAVECGWLAVAAWRKGLLPAPSWSWRHVDARHVFSRYAPLVLSSVLISSSVVIDQAMAASLDRGSISILNYGNKIVSLLLGVVAASLSAALFPSFSRMIGAGQWQALRATTRRFAIGVALGSIPCVVAVAVLAEPMIRLLFEHGHFTPADTRAASQVQVYLSLQIPFYVLVMVGFRLLAALDGYRVIWRIAALNLAINIVGDVVLMRYFGVSGIAMSTSLVYFVAAVATIVAIRIRMAEVVGNS
jgi:putative peptidoglycan lipid II flippase